MNRPFKILFGIFISLLLLGAFFCIFTFHVNIGYSAFTIDFIIGLVLLLVFIQTKGLARLPERTVGARVIAKNVKTEWVSSGDAGWNDYHYMVTFQSDNHDIWSFPLSIVLYNALSPGDYGTLIYKINKKGKVFFFFLRS